MVEKTIGIETIMTMGPVIPVVAVQEAEQGVDVARALLSGGIRVVEITLRTDAAWEAIAAVRGAVEDAVVGVGTVTRPDELLQAKEAGAQFAVSPGATAALLAAAARAQIPFLPGVATVSEAMAAAAAGFAHQKLFPAVPAGGVALLRAISGPLPHLRFCPTGGISEDTAPDFLALSNVLCVGGSWLVPNKAIVGGDWDTVTTAARRAAALGPAVMISRALRRQSVE